MLDGISYIQLAAIRRKGTWITAQVTRDPPRHFCLQYAGNGHYFNTLEELNAYSWKRWKLKFTMEGGVICGKRQAKRGNR